MISVFCHFGFCLLLLLQHNKDEFGNAPAVALMNGKRQDSDTLVASLHVSPGGAGIVQNAS
jgi:hypothetical protein